MAKRKGTYPHPFSNKGAKGNRHSMKVKHGNTAMKSKETRTSNKVTERSGKGHNNSPSSVLGATPVHGMHGKYRNGAVKASHRKSRKK